MLTSIIFSKNRPLQLDLCLSSFKKNLNTVTSNIVVIYDCDKEYVNSYKHLRLEHPEVSFWKQGRSLFDAIYIALSAYENNYACFFTDDCIVYRKEDSITDQSIEFIFKLDCVSCFSMRLGENINIRTFDGGFIHDPLIYSDSIKVARASNGMICWNRTLHFHGGYWNYPLSVDGHIFRRRDLMEWVEEIVYLDKIKDWDHTPNTFEKILQRFNLESPPMVACPRLSCVVNSPNNRVQNSINNANGEKYFLDPLEMLKLFKQGKRIDVDKLDITNIRCPHTEIDLMKGLS